MDSTLRFGAIDVIESLPSDERPTGQHLVDEVLTPARYHHHPGLGVHYRRVVTAAELLAALDGVAARVEDTGAKPLVHIEAHGGQHGMRVASGEYVPWSALKAALTRINLLTGLHLTVMMAACSGHYLSRILLPTEPAPAWMVIGPHEPVWDADLYEAMAGFYRGLLDHGDAERALFDMNGGRPMAQWSYLVQPAEDMFRRAFSRYLADATPDALREREDLIVDAFLQRRGTRDPRVAAEARIQARAMLADHAGYFDLLKSRFFMLDDWPENRGRFLLTYEDCLGTPPVGVAGAAPGAPPHQHGVR